MDFDPKDQIFISSIEDPCLEKQDLHGEDIEQCGLFDSFSGFNTGGIDS